MKVDAFTESAFKGNPAAVCLLEEEKEDSWMQGVATEFNLSETCYFTPIAESERSDISLNRFRLRWFTPATEVELCGHATLASAHVLFSSGLVKSDIIEFVTLSGVLTAKKVSGINDGEGASEDGLFIELDFPADTVTEFNSADISQISAALNDAPIIDIKRTTVGDHLLVELASGKDVVELQPDIGAIAKCPGGGILVSGTAPPESGFDYYCRTFFPKVGINEDPITGSAQCALAPYWAKKMGKCDLSVYAASPRGGVVHVHFDDQSKRILMRGKANFEFKPNCSKCKKIVKTVFSTMMGSVTSVKVEGEGDVGVKLTVTSTMSPDVFAAIIANITKENSHKITSTTSPDMQLDAILGKTAKENSHKDKAQASNANQEENNNIEVSYGQNKFKGHQGTINLQGMTKNNRIKQLELVQNLTIKFNDDNGEASQKGTPPPEHASQPHPVPDPIDSGKGSENGDPVDSTTPQSQRQGGHNHSSSSPSPSETIPVSSSSKCIIM
ncbi:hypothetical protein JHK87_026618 [Glycine soja]|nr:hypothetical protein JHK87_026618 [Glycine soja]